MSHIVSSHDGAVLVRTGEAERVGFPPQMVRLLAMAHPPAESSARSELPCRAASMAPTPTTTPRRPSCSMS